MMRRARIRLFTMTATIAAGAGCGSGSSPAGDPSCAHFAHATCTMVQACEPVVLGPVFADLGACLTFYEQTCAMWLSAPDTGLSPALAEQCSQAVSALTCDELVGGSMPAACVARGLRARGRPCGTHWQCASGHCSVPLDAQCGSCVDAVPVGGGCIGDECGDGLRCAFDPVTQTGSCEAVADVGSTCRLGQFCTGAAFCSRASPTDPEGICTNPKAVGESCAEVGCDYLIRAACNPSNLVCQAPVSIARPGQECGWIGDQLVGCNGNCGPRDASGVSICNPRELLATEGQPCAPTPPNVLGDCELGLACVNGVCTKLDPASCG
jgi:hypothetical protein